MESYGMRRRCRMAAAFRGVNRGYPQAYYEPPALRGVVDLRATFVWPPA